MKFLKFSVLASILGLICYIFYTQEVKYLLPTPVPSNLNQISLGSILSDDINNYLGPKGRVKFVHFYNPECPCSRFNKKHVAELIFKYRRDADFYSVIEKYTLSGSDNLLDGEKNLIKDENEKLAALLGVYSTPQAVIIGPDNKLLYRGNFNQARYCTTTHTAFAQNALDSILKGSTSLLFPKSATQSYGCSIY